MQYGPLSYHALGWVYPRDQLRCPPPRPGMRSRRGLAAILPVPIPVIITATCLTEAVAAWWLTRADLLAAFPGGFSLIEAARQSPLRRVVFSAPTTVHMFANARREFYNTTIEFYVYAGTDTAAMAGAAAIRNVIVPQSSPPIRWEWDRGGSAGAELLKPDVARKAPMLGKELTQSWVVCVSFRIRNWWFIG